MPMLTLVLENGVKMRMNVGGGERGEIASRRKIQSNKGESRCWAGRQNEDILKRRSLER